MNDKASNPTDITAFGLVSVPAVLVYEHIMRRPEERRRRMAFKAFALTFLQYFSRGALIQNG
jgi:hypothetical protein